MVYLSPLFVKFGAGWIGKKYECLLILVCCHIIPSFKPVYPVRAVKCLTIGSSARIIKLKHCYNKPSSKWREVVLHACTIFRDNFSFFPVGSPYSVSYSRAGCFLQTAQFLILMFVFPYLWHPMDCSMLGAGGRGEHFRWGCVLDGSCGFSTSLIDSYYCLELFIQPVVNVISLPITFFP